MEKGRPKADCSRVINEGNEDSNKEVAGSTSSSSSSRVSSNVPTKRKRAGKEENDNLVEVGMAVISKFDCGN